MGKEVFERGGCLLKMTGEQSVSPVDLDMWRQCFSGRVQVRVPDLDRRKKVGSQRYKKGYEVRIVASSRDELARIAKLLRKARFKPGRPFSKGRRTILPVYGIEAVRASLAVRGEALAPQTPPTRAK